MPVSEGVQPRVGVGTYRSFRARYKFGTQGGTVGAKTLTDPLGRVLKLPNNFEILRAFTVVNTPMTSAGAATVKLGFTGNDDAFVGATAFDHATWDVADDIASRAADLPVKTTAVVSVLATIADFALTAGEFDVIIEGYQGS